jgi:AmmeMemoRadiSam system protein A
MMKTRLDPIADPVWEEKRGAFVRLMKNGVERGCVGLLESSTSLAETLFDAGASAATHDDRYPPVKQEELADLNLEVTLISKVEKLKSPESIVVGESGLIVSRGDQRAVLLPQVAQDFNWNSLQFLEACCEKARLPHTSWQDPNTLVEVFTVQNIKAGPLLPLIEKLV